MIESINRKMQRVRHWRAYLMSGRNAVSYTGWLGHQNLGDEILHEAAEECFASVNLVSYPLSNRNFLNRLAATKRHSLAVLGGGTLIGGHPPFERYKSELAKAKGGLVFGAGVSPLAPDAPIPPWLENWGSVLRTLAYAGVRGPDSAATLARVGVNAEVLGDPVCWFSQAEAYWQPKDKLMGLNVGQANGSMYGDENTVQKVFADFARAAIQRGWKIEFFCVWPEDLEVTRKVAAEAGINNPTIHCIYQNARVYQDRVRSMKVYVGIKLHAVALAMSANVPSLMIEYRPKCMEFMNTMGMGAYVRRCDQISVQNLLESLKALDAGGEEIAQKIRAAMVPIQQRLRSLGEQVKNGSLV